MLSCHCSHHNNNGTTHLLLFACSWLSNCCSQKLFTTHCDTQTAEVTQNQHSLLYCFPNTATAVDSLLCNNSLNLAVAAACTLKLLLVELFTYFLPFLLLLSSHTHCLHWLVLQMLPLAVRLCWLLPSTKSVLPSQPWLVD